MNIRVRVDSSMASRRLISLYRDQVPFATSLAINETAKKVQAAQRILLLERFRIRRPWVLHGVKIVQWAKKQFGLRKAVIRIAESHDFLEKFEEGGTKTPRDGGRLAIPDEVRRGKNDIVPRSQRPRAFNFKPIGRGAKAETFAGDKRTFMIRTQWGTGGIFQRVGRRKNARLKELFTFARQARIPAKLDFKKTANEVVRRVFAGEFRRAFAIATSTKK